MEENLQTVLPFITLHVSSYQKDLILQESEVLRTDIDGIADLSTSTATRNLDLQIIEAGPNFARSPIFEIFDENNYLQRPDVSVNILPREVSCVYCICV